MAKTHLTEEQRAAIIADLRAKRPYKEMMAEYGLSWYVLSQTGLRAGVPLRGPGIRPPEILPEVGQVFGRLTVIAPREPGAGGMVPCRCECGTEVRVRANNLACGQTRSCGCLKLDVNVKAMHAALPPPHYLSRTRLYSRWASMIQRCTNPENPSYKRYGGRGIKVDETLRDPLAYFALLEGLIVPAGMAGNEDDLPMSELTDEQRSALLSRCSIDRIDNNGNYEPGNLRWATPVMQRHNRRPALRNRGALELLAEWEATDAEDY